MRQELEKLLQSALLSLRERGGLEVVPPVSVERCRDDRHGDFASPVALGLARELKRKPREIAQAIVDALPASEQVSKVEIAGPGFINFFLTPEALHSVVFFASTML